MASPSGARQPGAFCDFDAFAPWADDGGEPAARSLGDPMLLITRPILRRLPVRRHRVALGKTVRLRDKEHRKFVSRRRALYAAGRRRIHIISHLCNLVHLETE